MANSSDIQAVRGNTDEQGSETYTDDQIGALVDSLGVAGATAHVWEQKAAKFSSLVNVSEAGASHSFSDLYKNAASQAAYWTKKATDGEVEAGTTGRPRIRSIERS